MSKITTVWVLIFLLSQTITSVAPFFISKMLSAIMPSRSTAPTVKNSGKSLSNLKQTPNSATNPMLKLSVKIPNAATVHYEKELDVTSGGQFTLETPMEKYQYSSNGNIQLKCVIIQYLMQSTYTPNLMCFYLHFLIYKHNDKGQRELCFWTIENNAVPYNPQYYY